MTFQAAEGLEDVFARRAADGDPNPDATVLRHAETSTDRAGHAGGEERLEEEAFLAAQVVGRAHASHQQVSERRHGARREAGALREPAVYLRQLRAQGRPEGGEALAVASEQPARHHPA